MDFSILGISSIPAIMVICVLVANIVKTFQEGKYAKDIPIFCGVFGMLLGLVCYFVAPNLIAAEDPITALAIGVASGLSATGAYEVVKQQIKAK